VLLNDRFSHIGADNDHRRFLVFVIFDVPTIGRSFEVEETSQRCRIRKKVSEDKAKNKQGYIEKKNQKRKIHKFDKVKSYAILMHEKLQKRIRGTEGRLDRARLDG